MLSLPKAYTKFILARNEVFPYGVLAGNRPICAAPHIGRFPARTPCGINRNYEPFRNDGRSTI